MTVPAGGAATMRLRVTSGRCEGHGMCYLVDPDLFPLGEDGLTAVVDGAEVPEGMEAIAEEGVQSCPVMALALRASGER
jgi:ferredoxin